MSSARHNLKKASKNFKEVKDKELGKGLRNLVKALRSINKQLKKTTKR